MSARVDIQHRPTLDHPRLEPLGFSFSKVAPFTLPLFPTLLGSLDFKPGTFEIDLTQEVVGIEALARPLSIQFRIRHAR